MPYRRNNRRSRRAPRNLSKAVRSEVKKIAYSTQETKHHRVNVASTGLPASGFWTELNTVDSQSVASGGFVGQEIRQIGIRLKGYMSQADSSNIVRMVIVTPTANKEAQTAQGTAFTDDLFYAGDPLLQPFRESAVKRVYLDRTFILNMSNGQNDKIVMFNEWIKLNMRRYTVDESNLPSGTLGAQKVYIAFVSDSSIASHPTLNLASCLYYKDA